MVAWGYQHRTNKHFLTQDELDLIEALQLLLFLRNRLAHRMEHYDIFRRTHARQDFNSLVSERVSHGCFPLILVFLQWQLHQRNLLGSIPAFANVLIASC